MLSVFWAFIKKETLHILRDARTLYILFGMPIALVLIFGYTVTNEFKGASIAIVDQAKDELSKEFSEHLLASGHFKLVEMPMTSEQLEEAFQAGRIKLAVVIPSEFERNFYKEKKATVQLLSDATEPNYAETLTNYANRMVMAFQQQKSSANQGIPYQIDIETRMFYNPELVGAYNFIPGVVALILMLICAMMTSLTIAKEKEMGTMDLLLVSPLPPLLIIVGKVVPYVVLSFINAIVVFAMGKFIFGVPILGSLPMLLGLTALYLMVALALGILISTTAQDQQTAMMFSLFTLLMPTMLLSGFIFPIASMPTVLQYLAKTIPANYFIAIEKAIMLKGAGVDAVWFPAMILTIMLLLLLTAALRNFKVRYG